MPLQDGRAAIDSLTLKPAPKLALTAGCSEVALVHTRGINV